MIVFFEDFLYLQFVLKNFVARKSAQRLLKNVCEIDCSGQFHQHYVTKVAFSSTNKTVSKFTSTLH